MSNKIMIVDDSVLARGFIKDALAKGDFDVVAEAGDGNQAIALMKTTNPDLVTMDVSMPELDGEEALRRIMEVNPKSKIVMLTSLAEPLMEEDLLKMGAKAVLKKPFEAEEFRQVLQKILRENT